MTLKRNLAWMGFGQGFFFLLQFGSSVVLARLLSPYEMGVFAIAAALVGLLALVQAFGMGNYIVREKALDPGDVATAFTINAVIALALALTLIGVGLLAGNLLEDPGARRVLIILALVPLIGIFELLPFAQLERRGQFKLLVAVGMTRNITAVAVTVPLAFMDFSYLSIAYGQVAGAITGALTLNIVGREHVSFRLSLHNWRKLLTFGGQMLAISGVNALAIRAADLLLGKILGLAALGLYTRAAGVYRLFWDNLHLVIGRVLFVDLAEKARRGESLRDSYLLISEIMTATLWPAFAGLAILSTPLFHLVYGAKWVDAALPFSLLAIAAIIQVSITMTWELFTIKSETSRQAKIEFVRTGVGLALFTAGCFVSLTAAAATRVVETLFSMVLYRSHLQRMTETQFKDFIPIYCRSAVLTLAATAPSAALIIYWRNAPDLPTLQLLGAVAAGVSLWSLGLVIMGHPLIVEAKRVIARLRQE